MSTQDAVDKLNVFFWGLHSLIQYAKTTTSFIMQAELSEELQSPHPVCIAKHKEPGALRII